MIGREQMLELMAYADGELEGDARAAVEARLATDDEAARFVAELGSLGEVVREGFEASAEADRVMAFDVADAVMARVAKEEAPSSRAASNLRSLDAARQKRFPLVPVLVGVVAAAAAVLLVARRPAEAPLAAKGPDDTAAQAAALAEGPGVEVEAVESPGNSVSVFYLPGASALQANVVVWVDETGEK